MKRSRGLRRSCPPRRSFAPKRSFALGALFVLLPLVACQGPPPLRALPADDFRPRALLENWVREAGERSALRGSLRLAVDARAAAAGERDLSFRSRQSVVLARPASLRVEVRSPLGTTVAVFATDGEYYDLFRVDDRSLESGRVFDALLWEVARLDLTPAEAVDLLLGVPDPERSLTPASAFDTGDGGVRIELADADRSVRRLVDFDTEGRLRWLQQRDVRGVVAWEASFDDYELVAQTPVAHTIRIESRGGKTRAVLSLAGVELNPDLTPDLFRLDWLGEENTGDAGGR